MVPHFFFPLYLDSSLGPRFINPAVGIFIILIVLFQQLWMALSPRVIEEAEGYWGNIQIPAQRCYSLSRILQPQVVHQESHSCIRKCHYLLSELCYRALSRISLSNLGREDHSQWWQDLLIVGLSTARGGSFTKQCGN